MRIYELVLVLRTTLSDADRKNLLDSIKEWLGDIKIAKEDEWGQKPLAYPIKHQAAGVYLLLHLEGENAIPAGFEKRLLNNDSILRHLLIRNK